MLVKFIQRIRNSVLRNRTLTLIETAMENGAGPSAFHHRHPEVSKMPIL